MEVENLRPDPVAFLAAFPDISGFRLGEGPANLQTTLRDGGSIVPAWSSSGGIYGNGTQQSMQWHALFDRPSGTCFGLIVPDAELRNKWFRFTRPRMEVLYFPAVTLRQHETWATPRTRLILSDGDWKPIALAYRDWFSSAFRMAARPAWVDAIDTWAGFWFGKLGGIPPQGGCGGLAHCLHDFSELPEIYRQDPADMLEAAYHTEGSSRNPKVHTDGDNILRKDLGGAPALKVGVAGVHRLGYRFAFYVEGYIVHESSDLVKSGKAARWSVMHQDGSITGNYTKQGFYHMCPGSVEWQDHLVEVCSRLVRETGADGIRLDSLGGYYLTCYNPAHHHSSPYDYNRWIRQLLEKVERGVRAVNPEAVLATESPVDFYSQWFHCSLDQPWPIDREVPPIRLALAGYRPFVYSPYGPLFGSLSGLAGGTGGDAGNVEARTLGENWRSMRHGVARTLLEGQVALSDPQPSLSGVTCRLFHGVGHSVVVCARLQNGERWRSTRLIQLVKEHQPFTVRLGGFSRPVESGGFYDLEKATLSKLAFTRDAGGLRIEVKDTNWFMAVLREPGSAPLGSLDAVRELKPGDSAELSVDVLGATGQLPATVSAKGLEFAGGASHLPITVPGKAKLVVPAGTPPGRYQIQLDGPGLVGMKRFVVVTGR